MSLLRRLVDMIAGKPPPPYDERSRNAVLIDKQQAESDATLKRAERVVPSPVEAYRRVNVGRR
jgi:hypothetical protein